MQLMWPPQRENLGGCSRLRLALGVWYEQAGWRPQCISAHSSGHECSGVHRSPSTCSWQAFSFVGAVPAGRLPINGSRCPTRRNRGLLGSPEKGDCWLSCPGGRGGAIINTIMPCRMQPAMLQSSMPWDLSLQRSWPVLFLKETVRQGRCLKLCWPLPEWHLIQRGYKAQFHFNRGSHGWAPRHVWQHTRSLNNRQLKKTPPGARSFWLMLIAFATTLPMAPE